MTSLDKLGPYWNKKVVIEPPTIPYVLLIFNDVGQINSEPPTGTAPYYTAGGEATGNLNQILEYYNSGPEIGGAVGPAWGISFPSTWYKSVAIECSVAPIPPPLWTYEIEPVFSAMTCKSEILSWMASQVPALTPLSYGQGFNASNVPMGGNVLPGNYRVKISDWSIPVNFIGSGVMPYITAGNGYIYQIKIVELLRPGCNYVIGYFTQAYGPPFNSNALLGGPLGTVLRSDGVTSWIISYGGAPGDTSGLPPLKLGSVVTVVIVPDDSKVGFFIDCAHVGNGVMSNANGFALAGSTPP